MNKVFLTKGEVVVNKAGYLVDSNNVPVMDEMFVDLQRQAQYLVTLAAKYKTMDFVGKEANTLIDLHNAVEKELSKKDKNYVSTPKEPKQELTDKLTKEAKDFIGFLENSDKADKVNKCMQKFNVLSEFEEFGLFFDQGIVKLEKIYTIEEIVKAVEVVIDIL